jgi:hypothetical protein
VRWRDAVEGRMQTTTRRGLVAGMAAIGIGAIAKARPVVGGRDPDLGPNVLFVDPGEPGTQAVIARWFKEQERAHFTDRRRAILLKPGTHRLDINVGFFTQVAGLGVVPGDVTVIGNVHAEADWTKGMALVNFWRSAENLTVRPPGGMDRWAVSQAAPYRRIHLAGDLALDDGGWSSGGFMADCRVDGTIRSGTQQQWFTCNSGMGAWEGSNWNMMFMGVADAPASSFPTPPYTTRGQCRWSARSRSYASGRGVNGPSSYRRCGVMWQGYRGTKHPLAAICPWTRC